MNEPAPRQGKGRAGRPAQLTSDLIVRAAVEVLDAEGLDALTMRRLGSRLGVAAMSLYRHVPNRDALLAAVVNRLFADTVIEFDPGMRWQEALPDFAAAYRRMLLGHPNAVPLLATHPVDVELGLELLAGLLDRFAAAGIPLQDATTAIQSVGVYVLGHALAQVGTPPGATEQAAPADAGVVEFYDQWFESGLLAMVTGFDHRLPAR
jgi:TetR/AcrR family tetracycline transcriptional repressor